MNNFTRDLVPVKLFFLYINVRTSNPLTYLLTDRVFNIWFCHVALSAMWYIIIIGIAYIKSRDWFSTLFINNVKKILTNNCICFFSLLMKYYSILGEIKFSCCCCCVVVVVVVVYVYVFW